MMKKLILTLAVLFSALSGFSQDYDQITSDAFAKVLSPYFDDFNFFYKKGFFNSVYLEFNLFGWTRYYHGQNCPREVTGIAWVSDEEYPMAKKGASAIRKLLLEEAKKTKVQTSIYVGRMLSGTSPMIFRVSSKTDDNLYFDIKVTDQEIFGVPFDQVDKKKMLHSIVDHLNMMNKDKPRMIIHMSDDDNWLLYSYKRTEKYYRQDEAFRIAQQFSADLFAATKQKYFENGYFYLAVPFGMGIMVEVSNQDSHETAREWITPEEVRECCFEEGHKYHGPYENTWFLKLPGLKISSVREYSDALTLELWCTWYDLLGGEWSVERIMDMIQQAMSDPDSPMGEIIAICQSSSKPFHVILNSRFGIQFSGQLPIGE